MIQINIFHWLQKSQTNEIRETKPWWRISSIEIIDYFSLPQIHQVHTISSVLLKTNKRKKRVENGEEGGQQYWVERCEVGQGLGACCRQDGFWENFLMYWVGKHGASGWTDEKESDEEAIGSDPQLPSRWSHQPRLLVLSLIQPKCDQVGNVGEEKYDPW